jgi:hypothetical protein
MRESLTYRRAAALVIAAAPMAAAVAALTAPLAAADEQRIPTVHPAAVCVADAQPGAHNAKWPACYGD